MSRLASLLALAPYARAVCDGFDDDCKPRTAEQCLAECGVACEYAPMEGSFCGNSSGSASSGAADFRCSKDGAELSCARQDVLICKVDRDMSKSSRPEGSPCDSEGRKCLGLNDDASASEVVRCASPEVSNCFGKREGESCRAGAAQCISLLGKPALMCVSDAAFECYGKAAEDDCFFTGRHSERMGKKEASKCGYDLECQEPAKGACVGKGEGDACAYVSQMDRCPEVRSSLCGDSSTQTPFEYFEVFYSGGTCEGASREERTCAGATETKPTNKDDQQTVAAAWPTAGPRWAAAAIAGWVL